MRILITNDDGYKSPILPVLASWAKKHGEVTLVAPKSEQSGKSQSIDFRNAVEIKKVDIVEGVDCYYVDSTPADCVRFAVTGLKKEYDLVISGVNCGYNLGSDINYSGTIGAIMEGARCGFRGIAVSTDFDILMESEQYFDELFQYFTEKKLFKYNNLYNVNIPHKPVRGFRITKQGGIFYSDDVELVSCVAALLLVAASSVADWSAAFSLSTACSVAFSSVVASGATSVSADRRSVKPSV